MFKSNPMPSCYLSLKCCDRKKDEVGQCRKKCAADSLGAGKSLDKEQKVQWGDISLLKCARFALKKVYYLPDFVVLFPHNTILALEQKHPHYQSETHIF